MMESQIILMLAGVVLLAILWIRYS